MNKIRRKTYKLGRILGDAEAAEHGYERGGVPGAIEGEGKRQVRRHVYRVEGRVTRPWLRKLGLGVLIVAVLGTLSLAVTTPARAAAAKHKPCNGTRHHPTLTGLGATRVCWNKHHKADRNHKLAKGCCYLPKAHRDGLDRYSVVMATHSVITGWTMSFGNGTSRADVDQALRSDLPRDVQVVGTGTSPGTEGGTCGYVDYRSAQLGKAWSDPNIGNPSGSFEVLYVTTNSNGETLNYRASNVNEADVLGFVPPSNSQC